MQSELPKNVLSVVALAAGFLLSIGLAAAAVLVGFCGLFGEQCSAEEQQTMGLLSLASIGVFLLVPAAVAAVRRQARWLLAPVVEVALLTLLVALNSWF